MEVTKLLVAGQCNSWARAARPPWALSSLTVPVTRYCLQTILGIGHAPFQYARVNSPYAYYGGFCVVSLWCPDFVPLWYQCPYSMATDQLCIRMLGLHNPWCTSTGFYPAISGLPYMFGSRCEPDFPPVRMDAAAFTTLLC